jgi:hypothetical protein
MLTHSAGHMSFFLRMYLKAWSQSVSGPQLEVKIMFTIRLIGSFCYGLVWKSSRRGFFVVHGTDPRYSVKMTIRLPNRVSSMCLKCVQSYCIKATAVDFQVCFKITS